jgi:hypothetical protein
MFRYLPVMAVKYILFEKIYCAVLVNNLVESHFEQVVITVVFAWKL